MKVPMYVLPELQELIRDPKLFPLLANKAGHFFEHKSKKYFTKVQIAGKIIPLFSGGIVTNEEVELVAQCLSRTIIDRYRGQRLLVVVLLEGARPFADMVQSYLHHQGGAEKPQPEFATLAVRSYPCGSQRNQHQILYPLSSYSGVTINNLRAYDALLILDDLIDSGETLYWLMTDFFTGPSSCTVEASFMLEKNVDRRPQIQAEIDRRTILIGRKVPDEWVVGFGLDLALKSADGETSNLFRQTLPGGIYAFNKKSEKAVSQEYRKNPISFQKALQAYM